ncbi:porin [Robbsia andropogonis]|uniref:porin n=1 Tax=Robbsia andropogonis TaxID=28092 RepID=UPI00209E6A22|nr:porin [Robbsia andropogonis]MCP1120727.1 porin [Robbsia andropogonis]MCP1130461.1 porin [Robbsia andropogonis]
MKKLVCIAACAIGSVAHAQSNVTLYGVVDGGLLYQNKNGGPGAGGPTSHSSFLFSSGGNTSNRFGLLGIEDLGGGLKAGFQLEGQFSLGTGALSATNTLFGHYANVFLRTPYGQVTAGLQQDPAYYAFGRVDPRDLKQAFSAAGFWNFNEGRSTSSAVTVYESNSLAYTYRTDSVYAGVLYHFGNQSGSLAQGQTVSAGAAYTGDPLIAEVAYVQKNDTTGTRDLRVWSLGGGYRLGTVTLKAAWTDYDQPLGNAISQFGVTGPSDIRVLQAGANWNVTPATRLTLAYYWAEDRKNTQNATTTVVLSDDYLLSKATSVYGYVGWMNAKKGANGLTNLITASLTGGVAGQNTTAVGVGISHKF